MTTTREQFKQRLAELSDPWLTRRQMEYLAGVTAKTMRNWISAFPIPEEETRIGARGAQLIARDAAAHFVSARLSPDSATAETRSGPRLPVEPMSMTHAPGERWRWTDMARLRGVTPGAVSNLAKAYAEHATHPFPLAGNDKKRDAAKVAAWFRWYDSERPGYARCHEDQQDEDEPSGRIGQVAEMLRRALTEGTGLDARAVAAELDISDAAASRYIAKAATIVTPEHDLISRAKIADLEPAASRRTPEQRRQRVTTLLRRQSAPQPVITAGGTDYFRLSDIERFLGVTG